MAVQARAKVYAEARPRQPDGGWTPRPGELPQLVPQGVERQRPRRACAG